MDLSSECLDLMYNKKYDTFNAVLHRVNTIFDQLVISSKAVTKDFVDDDYFDEIKTLAERSEFDLMIGKTLRDLKVTVKDDHNREHSCFVTYKEKAKLRITNTTLPHDTYEEQDYANVEDCIAAYKDYVDSLCNYLMELERVDRFCTIIEPKKPTFKDNYRKILLETKLWLHLEVMNDGTATNIHLIGNPGIYREKLQEGIAAWDHDKDIVDNVVDIFDLMHFTNKESEARLKPSLEPAATITPVVPVEITCGICLASELDNNAMPQPLCQNEKCGVFYHTECLYQWLVISNGGREPGLGIATGVCPSCFQQITVYKSTS